MAYRSTIKKNNVAGPTWKNLKGVMLNKRSQS